MRYRLECIIGHIFLTVIQIVILGIINDTTWGHERIAAFILISIAINIYMFVQYYSIARHNDLKFSGKLSKSAKNRPLNNTPLPSSMLAYNTIEMAEKSLLYGEDMTLARYEDGKVYCISRNNSYCIGCYRVEDDHVFVGAKDGREIGRVSLDNGRPNLIFLSNVGWYKRFSIAYNGEKPFTLLAAEIFVSDSGDSHIILDNKTNEVVARYRGDPIGASAAFICMQYDCSRSGKYHDFYYGSSSS